MCVSVQTAAPAAAPACAQAAQGGTGVKAPRPRQAGEQYVAKRRSGMRMHAARPSRQVVAPGPRVRLSQPAHVVALAWSWRGPSPQMEQQGTPGATGGVAASARAWATTPSSAARGMPSSKNTDGRGPQRAQGDSVHVVVCSAAARHSASPHRASSIKTPVRVVGVGPARTTPCRSCTCRAQTPRTSILLLEL